MAEKHTMVGHAEADPLPKGQKGARVRISLANPPSEQWARAFGNALSEIRPLGKQAGHFSSGHGLVQGNEIVLVGVESKTGSELFKATTAALAQANKELEDQEKDQPSLNMSQEEADAIAAKFK